MTIDEINEQMRQAKAALANGAPALERALAEIKRYGTLLPAGASSNPAMCNHRSSASTYCPWCGTPL